MASVRIICPNGHLGFAPLKPESFEIGVARPDFIAADSGSDDVGPVPLGADTSTSPRHGRRTISKQMLLASRELGVPMIIGSAGDTGTNSRVDLFVAHHPGARRASIGCRGSGRLFLFRGRQGARCAHACAAGDTVEGLDGRAGARPKPSSTPPSASSRWPACIPTSKLLDTGRRRDHRRPQQRLRDLRRAGDPRTGFPEALAYYLGKVLECASFCAEPYGGKETVLGEITTDDVQGDGDAAGAALHGRLGRRPRDVRAVEPVLTNTSLGGTLDMTRLPLRAGRRAHDAHHRRRDSCLPRSMRVKLEGAGKVGERYVGMVGIRDPYTIAHIDEVIDWARAQVRERFGDSGLRAALHRLRPQRRHGRARAADATARRTSCCIMVQGVAPTAAMAEEVCMIGTRQMFYARLPDVKGTAGGVAFPLDEVMRGEPGLSLDAQPHAALSTIRSSCFPTHIVDAATEQSR